MASPQIAGLAALYLQANPLSNNLASNNSLVVKNYITNRATSTMNAPGNAFTYTNFRSTLGGSAIVGYQFIQGFNQIKTNDGNWKPVANVYIKSASSWQPVKTVWSKTATGWNVVFNDV